MTLSLHEVLRKTPPIVCRIAGFLTLTALLTGCGPEQGEPLFPYVHNAANVGDMDQTVTALPTDFRHHPHALRASQPHRHQPFPN